MPPKRKAARSVGGGKKAKTEPAPAQTSTAQQMVDALKKAGDDRKKTTKVDSYCYQLANNGQVSFSAAVDVHLKVKVGHTAVVVFVVMRVLIKF